MQAGSASQRSGLKPRPSAFALAIRVARVDRVLYRLSSTQSSMQGQLLQIQHSVPPSVLFVSRSKQPTSEGRRRR